MPHLPSSSGQMTSAVIAGAAHPKLSAESAHAKALGCAAEKRYPGSHLKFSSPLEQVPIETSPHCQVLVLLLVVYTVVPKYLIRVRESF